MAHLKLQVENRIKTGNSVRTLRRDGYLPAVFYSKSVSPSNIQIKQGDFNKLFKLSGKTHVIDLNIDDKSESVPVIVHKLDIHPVTGNVRHVDFLVVKLNEKVNASVPLTFTGESKAVKQDGGILNIVLEEVDVEALPDNIPNTILVDVSILENFDDVIRIENLPVSPDYVFSSNPQDVIASVTTSTVEEVQETTVVTPAETTTTQTKAN